MNKDTIQLDKNTYAVITDNDNTRIISTLNSENQETIKNILLQENKIEEIEKKLKQYKDKLETIKINTIYGETLNVISYTTPIAMLILMKPTNILQWIVLGTTSSLTYIFIKIFSIGAFESRKKRNTQKQEIEEEIPHLEEILKNEKKELKRSKKQSSFTELTHLNDKTTNYNYVYKYDSSLCDFSQISEKEKNKEIHVMKLTKIKKNTFQEKNL